MPGQPKIAFTALNINTPGSAYNCAHHAPPGAEAYGHALQAAITKTTVKPYVRCCLVPSSAEHLSREGRIVRGVGAWAASYRSAAAVICRPFRAAPKLLQSTGTRPCQPPAPGNGAGLGPGSTVHGQVFCSRVSYPCPGPGPGPAPGLARMSCPGPGPGAVALVAGRAD